MIEKMKTDSKKKVTGRNLTFSFSLPVGESGNVSINSVGNKTEELIDFEANIKVKTKIEDIESIVKLIGLLVKRVDK